VRRQTRAGRKTRLEHDAYLVAAVAPKGSGVNGNNYTTKSSKQQLVYTQRTERERNGMSRRPAFNPRAVTAGTRGDGGQHPFSALPAALS
jgi:hypothetical protein